MLWRGTGIVRGRALEYETQFRKEKQEVLLVSLLGVSCTGDNRRSGVRPQEESSISSFERGTMSSPVQIIHEYAEEGARLRAAFFRENAEHVERIALVMARCLAAGGKILTCGNGGSAADAQHLSGELVGRFLLERPALPSVALTVDTSILTAVGNDYGFDEVFARQVRGLGRQGDVLIALSTSGKSPNIIKALEVAKRIGLVTVGLTGKGGGQMPSLCDYLLDVPHLQTPLVQEIHGTVVHLLCRLVDWYLFENAAALHAAEQGA